jgi:hypothetical protein
MQFWSQDDVISTLLRTQLNGRTSRRDSVSIEAKVAHYCIVCAFPSNNWVVISFLTGSKHNVMAPTNMDDYHLYDTSILLLII